MNRTQSFSDFYESEDRTPESSDHSGYEENMMKIMESKKPEYALGVLYKFFVTELGPKDLKLDKVDFSEQLRSVERLIDYELTLVERENQIVLLSLTYELFISDKYAAKYEIMYKDHIGSLADSMNKSNVGYYNLLVSLLYKYYARELAAMLSSKILFLPLDDLSIWNLKVALFCRNINKFIGGFGIFTESTAAMYRERVHDTLKHYVYNFYVSATDFLCNWYQDHRGLLSKSLESIGIKGAKSLTYFNKFNQEIRDNFSFLFNDTIISQKIANHKKICEDKLKKVDEDFSDYISAFFSPITGWWNKTV